ncbi:hypothetical protein ACYSNU_01910 [Enterococcus sp. LJL120]
MLVQLPSTLNNFSASLLVELYTARCSSEKVPFSEDKKGAHRRGPMG